MADTSRLARGETVPHVEVRTVEGTVFSYDTIWQRKNVVLVSLPATTANAIYAAELLARAPEFHARHSALVVTYDPVSGLPAPGVLIADRWGEVVHVAAVSDTGTLPGADDLLEWVDYVERRCPECEGEAR